METRYVFDVCHDGVITEFLDDEAGAIAFAKNLHASGDETAVAWCRRMGFPFGAGEHTIVWPIECPV